MMVIFVDTAETLDRMATELGNAWMGANGFRRCGCANLDRSRCPGWITDGRIVHAWARAVVVLLHGGPQSPAYDGSAPFFLGPKLHIGIFGQSSARPLRRGSANVSLRATSPTCS